MPGRPTDHANLDLNQFNLDVAKGRANGRILWQPRMGCWIGERRFRGEKLPEPYETMTWQDIHRNLAISARLYNFGEAIRSHEHPDVRITRRDLNQTDYEVLTQTPVGDQRALYRKSPNSVWHMPLKWPVSSDQEMKVAAWRERNTTWSWDQGAYDRNLAETGDLGAPGVIIHRTSVQKLYVEDMGPEEAIYAMIDYPATCEAYFEAMAVSQERMIEVINASPIELVNFGDNVHSGTLTPEWFKKYVLPVYQRRCELLHKAGKFVTAHWDGDCKPLLQYAQETGLDGIEAITPAPQGDVTLEEVKAGLGEMWLVDGIPAIYFDSTFSEQTLLDCAKKCLDLFAPHIILGISDEISYTGDVERIRLVGKLVDDYNAAR